MYDDVRLAVPTEPQGYWLMADGRTRWPCYNRPNRWRRFWYWALLGWTFVFREGSKP